MKKLLLFLIPLFLWAGSSWGQINYFQSFDGCNAASCSGWTISGGYLPSITGTAGSGYSPCNTASAKSNIYSGAATATLASTVSLGTSTGEPATVSMIAKAITYSSGAAAAAGACTWTASWATAAGGPWNPISSANNLSSTACNTYTFSSFTPTSGQPVFIRIVASMNSGDFWAVMDDISLTQAASLNPYLTPDPLSLNFGFTASGNTSASQSYVLSGDNLTSSPLTVTAPTGFEVSLDDVNWDDDVQISFTPPTLAGATVYVRFAPAASETSYSDIVTNIGGGSSADVTVTGHSYGPLSGDYLISGAKFNSAIGKEIYFEKQTKLVTKDVLVYSPSKEKKENIGKGDEIAEYDIETLPYDNNYVWVNQVVEEEFYVPMLNGIEYNGDLMAIVTDEKGSKSTFPTITAAVNILNQAGVSGPVRFLLDDTNYPSETFPMVINIQSSLPTATNTVTIRPNTSVVATVSGSSPSAAVFLVQNSYIIIDGSNSEGTDRSLTIENTSTTAPQVVRIGSVGTTPIVGTILKNCNIINGVNTSSAVVVTAADGTAGYFNNITLQNNSVQKAYIGIYCWAVEISGNGNGLVISDNLLDNTGANALLGVGLYVQGVDGFSLTNNFIGNTTQGLYTFFPTGIWTASGSKNGIVSENKIYNMAYTGTGAYAARGIAASPAVANANITISGNEITQMTSTGTSISYGIHVFSATSDVTVKNNAISNIKNSNTGGYAAIGLGLNSTLTASNIFAVNNIIHDVAGNGDASTTNWNGYGINILAGGGYKLYYNSVNLGTNQTLATGNPACLIISSAVTTANSLDIRNNIFSIPATVGANRFAVISNAANTVFEYIDYNDYYTSGPNIGRIGAVNRVDIIAWRTGTGQDQNSMDDNPQFVSNTYLRPIGGSPVIGAGDNSTGINTDFDGVTRDANNPTIGAYELPAVSPTLSVTPDNLNFGYVPSGGTSAELSYLLTGNFLTPSGGNITVTPPANFEISLTSGSNFSTSPIIIPYTGGALSETIYVIFKPTGSPADYIDVISNVGGGAANQNVAVSGSSILTYCTTGVGPTSSADSDLFRVQITEAGFDHNVGCTGILGVQDFTGLGAISLTQGMTYNMTITMGQCGSGTYTNVAKAWIDFGQDGIFDEPAELLGVVQGPTSSSGVAYSFSFSIPSGATLGETRLRVMQRETADPALVTPCAGFSWGSVHDYAVDIVVGSTDVLSWYNLQWPPYADISVYDNVTVYAQCWEPGVTGPDGPGAGIESWIGYSTVDATDVTDFESGWTWVLANYKLPVGNNDEYEAYLGADQSLGEGTYYYVSRFRYNNGPFTYGGFNTGLGNGEWDGIDDVSGVLTVFCPSITTYPYYESFETSWPPACWTNLNWDDSKYGAPRTGTKWAYSNTNGSQLTTGEFEIPGTGVYLFSFWYRAESASYPQDFEVFLSTDGINFTTSIFKATGITNTTYQEVVYLLNAYSNSSVWFRFVGQYGTGGFAYGVCIDDVAVIESPATAVWTGAIDSDWFDADNWDTYVPGPNTDVTIPAGLTNYPTIISDPAYCNDIFFGSAAGSTATLLDNGLLTVNGTATVERYFSGNDLDWHLVSPPVSNALADVFMAMYLQSFDEPTNSYAEIIDETTPLGVMEGYGLYSTLGATNTVTFNGNLNLGTQNKGFTANGMGWNLMGNPFASSIDWEMVTIPANMTNEVHYIEAATGNDLSYVQGGFGSGSQYIPPMQGFFVSATGTGTLSVGNAQRSHEGANIFYKSSNPELVVLKATNGLFSDEVWIHFNELAGEEHDGQFDAHKRISLSNPLLPQIFSYTPAGVKLSVNGMPEVQSVPVGFTALQSGEFTISAKETGDFTDLYLEDLFSGSVANILTDDYTFNYNEGDQMKRFILHFAPLSVADNAARNVNIWSYGNEVIVMVPELTNGHVKVYNMMGQEVVSSTVASGRNVITVPQAGNYVVALISNEVAITEKVVIK